MVLGFGHHSQKDPNVSSESRGRDPFIATGRGGAGNIIRSPSRSRDRSGNAIPPQAVAAAAVPNHLVSSGRGGAGNVRSPSRDPLDRQRAADAKAREEKLQEEYRAHEVKAAHSTGRGGAGNVATNPDVEERRGRDGGSSGGGGVAGLLRTLSRSRSREPRSNGKDSPKNRSQSRTRASEGSKLGKVDETSRSSEEASLYTTSTANGGGRA
ncbi:Protein of unknown function DUF3602 [Kalmanozyma brasiliensis GHG001]|uniref:Uncharacterized protein n=1 Tax=Kalmanozyma brasiliensis (strain GHG001) TaxID=1365824 RepID=V5GKB9_KALBG|nr:Protein of unknown function DUF3602 [Kalmanozyma brasiliensis GHG001]EST06412.1 Protein of unknown function DUF3602 [Kalmanozyma brasiliensis GHG001]